MLQLANRLYGTHLLSAADAHTIECTVDARRHLRSDPAGHGREHRRSLHGRPAEHRHDRPGVRHRRAPGRDPARADRRAQRSPGAAHRGRQRGRRRPSEGPPAVDQARRRWRATAASLPASRTSGEGLASRRDREHTPAMRNWRYVVGTFQVKIPVTTREVMLWPEENTLAIMKWRLGQLAPGNRWRPVLERYVGYIAARVDGLGGDSTTIQPSPNGVPVGDDTGREQAEFTGRVCEIVFDCFGDFEGFVLRDCRQRRSFRSCEPRHPAISCCGRVGSTSSSPCMSRGCRPGDPADRRDLLLITSTATTTCSRRHVDSAPEARLLGDRLADHQYRAIVLRYQRSTVPPGYRKGLQRRRGGDPGSARIRRRDTERAKPKADDRRRQALSAAITAARCHIRRSPASSSHVSDAPYMRGARCSIPRRCLAGAGYPNECTLKSLSMASAPVVRTGRSSRR